MTHHGSVRVTRYGNSAENRIGDRNRDAVGIIRQEAYPVGGQAVSSTPQACGLGSIIRGADEGCR